MQLHRDIDKIHAAGAELVLIGNGAPHFIAGFRELTGFRGPIYTDPSLEVFRAAHLQRGVARTLNPLSLGHAVKAFAHGSRQGNVEGDAWQQGGTLVIAPGGEVRWQHVSKRPGDNASNAQILSAL